MTDADSMEIQANLPDAPGLMPEKKTKGPRGRVTIFGTWCKGCGICVAFCPTGVLALDPDGRPFIAAAEKCTACHWCDTHCPDLAIIVRPVG